MNLESWKTVARETVLDQGKFLRVENHTVQLPDGQIIEQWPWIITPDFANILAKTPDGQYLIFRQTKYSVEGPSLAPVGGYLEPGEDPLLAAQRELLEETGYEAAAWEALGDFPIDGNRGAGRAYFFLARDARPTAKRNADDLEAQELLLFSREALQAALDAGEFKLLPWMSIVALALARDMA
jgi:ADP-ribose pyrophosphatase